MELLNADSCLQTGSAIHTAASQEALMELTLSAVQTSTTLPEGTRSLIATAVLDGRYVLGQQRYSYAGITV
jgi:hypothetical protein